MYTINTKGFNTSDKINITRKFLLPKILKTYSFNDSDNIFTNEIITHIIEKYTNNEIVRKK